MMGNAYPWSISLLMYLSSADESSTEWDCLWSPLSIIASKSDFCVSSSIGSIWQRDSFWIMLIILVLSLWRRNNFAKDVMSRNYNPYFIGMTFCDSIAASKSPLNDTRIFLLLIAASCVLLNKKMGFSNF